MNSHYGFACVTVAALLLGAAVPPIRGEEGPKPPRQAGWTFDTIEIGAKTVMKGLSISVGKDGESTVCYDLDLCRVAGAWGGGLSAREKLAPRGDHPRALGSEAFTNQAAAGFEWNPGAKEARPLQEPGSKFPRSQGGVANGEIEILKAEIVNLKSKLRNEPTPDLERLVAAHEKLLEAWTKDGSLESAEWTDPRIEPFGPLPNVAYRGMYVDGGKVLLKWTVNGTDILEAPGYSANAAASEFTRVLRIAPTKGELIILLAAGAVPGDWQRIESLGGSIAREFKAQSATIGGKDASIAAAGETQGVTLLQRGRSIYARIAASPTERTLSLAISSAAVASLEKHAPAFPDFAKFLKGGDPQTNQAATTTGEISAAKEAYVVDTVTIPDPNPWRSSMQIGGFDFFKDGRAALSTFAGDVFILTGLDEKLEHVKWRRFATGLYQPLGLRIVNGEVFVACRDGITRLKDLNGGGEADWYERFNNDLEVTANPYEFVCDLQTDTDGNFYFTKGGPIKEGGTAFDPVVNQHGAFMRVSADGRFLQTLATGLRAPNGMAVGPENQMTCGDTTGPGMPASRLNWIAQGAFYGAKGLSHGSVQPETSEDPLCWLPKEVDNSPGGQVWATDARWGPWVGRLLHTSYGRGALFGVLVEEVIDPQKPACCVTGMQGGVVRFPLKFTSGIMRARFNPADGQLYVSGLRGWGTTAGGESCFQRVRYTGAPVRMPIELHAKKDGMEIHFSCSLDTAKACDPDNWNVEVWNYPSNDAWLPPFSFADLGNSNTLQDGGGAKSPGAPQSGQHDRLTIKRATAGTDDRTVFLEIPNLRPVMQMSIKYKIGSLDGAGVEGEIVNSINALAQ